MTKLTALLVGLSLTLLLSAGCAVGPNYKRPSVGVPGMYRGTTPQDAAQPTTESLGEQTWWEVFQDKQLQDLIHTALLQNYDVRIAATRILQAQAQLGITRADQLPTISGGAQAVDEHNPRTKFFPQYETSANQVDLSLAWERDFWGKYRRATESARATLLATQWAREAIVSTLVGDVATAYFRLRSGQQPWPHRARNEVDRATACAGRSGGTSFQPAGATTRHSRGRSTVDGGQRSNWRRESGVLPAD